MGRMFDRDGRLSIPLKGGPQLLNTKLRQDGSKVIVQEAYCPDGHSLISEDVEIDGAKGLHFIYTNQDGTRETDIVLSPAVRSCRKTVLKGEPFTEGDTVRILCPTCRKELSVLVNCECGAPIYLFYLDETNATRQAAHSFCSRVGCSKASQLRFAEAVLKELVRENSF